MVLFVYDRATGKTTEHREIPQADFFYVYSPIRNLQFLPEMQGVLFDTSKSDLLTNDFNRASDVFLFPLAVKNETDNDHDGMSDEWERAVFGSMEQKADSDPDLDGYSNWQEFVSGTDPGLTLQAPNQYSG